jgi:autotransporter-associated beta strand protein
MRKVKALEVLAAAVVAVPCTVFAQNEQTVPARPGTIERLGNRNVLRPGYAAGRFTLSPSFVAGGGSEADGNFTWIGPDNGTWSVPTNWNPSGFPDGANAHAFITSFNGGGDFNTAEDVQLTGPITLNSLNFSDTQVATIHGPASGAAQTITMTGTAAINVTDFASERFPTTGKFFGNALGLAAITPNPARPIVLAGSAGLTINGPTNGKIGAVSTRANNTFTGNTTLNANTRYTVLPGSSLDGALGSSGNLVLNGGEFWTEIDNGSLNRGVVVNAAGGVLALGTDPANTGTSTQTINGVISGSGPLTIDNTFGGNGVFTAANTYSGNLRIMGAGTNTFQNNGFASAASIRNAGTVALTGSGNRLPDAGALQMNGGAIRMENAGSETVGSTTLLSATPAFIIVGTGTFNGGSLTRNPGTGMEVRGANLGTAGQAVVNFTNAAGFQTNGIIPWAYGHNQDPFFFGAESDQTELMSVGANGLIPRSANGGYLENTFTGSTATTNVRLRAGVNGQPGNNPNYTVAGNVSVNSLTMAPGFDESNNGVGGIFLNGAGVTVTVTSGAILSSSSGFNGAAINSGVGNTVNVNLAFGAAEAVFNCPGALTMNGNITGTGGLTKTGVRTLFMNGTGSTYTGTSTLTGFNRHKGNLLSGQPSAYGSSTSDILLVPFERIQNDPGLGATGINFVSFGPDAGAGVTTMTRGLRVVAGGNGELLSSLIRNFSGSTFNMNGQITVDAGADLVFQGLNPGANPYDVGGNIVGAGHASTAIAAGSQLTLVLRGNNTFSGGFDFAGGDVIAETNAAFGTGLMTVTGDSTLASTTGARTIGNQMLLSAGALRIRGTNPFTFTGNGALGGTLVDVNAGNTATFSGVLSEGGLFKEGQGSLVLTGNNTYGGTLSVGNIDQAGNPIDGGWIVLGHSNAGGLAVSNNQVQVLGASALGLTGGISTPNKPLLMTSTPNGPDGAGALRSLSGNNTYGGTVLLIDLAAAPGGPSNGSAGAAAGTTLNLARSVFVSGSGTASTFTFTKFGAGQVNVGAEQFTATRSNGATSSFQGSIVGVNNLVVNEGRLAMSASGAEGTHVSDVGSITLNGSSQFDLTNNALVVDYASAGPSPFADIRNKIVSGYNGGAWNGPGIISSSANNSTHGVGYAEANQVLTFTGSPPDALFLGDVVDQSAILARYTRYGDADLSGTVNLQDFNRLAANFGTGTRWDQGDFDYNGAVNLQDFNRLAANFGLSAAGPSVTPEDWARLGAAIPEPGSLGLMAVGASALLRRRRRA